MDCPRDDEKCVGGCHPGIRILRSFSRSQRSNEFKINKTTFADELYSVPLPLSIKLMILRFEYELDML